MKARKGGVRFFVLTALEKAFDGMVVLDDFIDNTYKYSHGPNLFPTVKKSSIAESIRRLRDEGYVEKDIAQGKTILKLTSLGKDYLGTNVEWDGKYRIVFWDIPEKNRRVRDLFRRNLKQWGFKNWQRSVWISKSSVTDELRDLVNKLGIEKWVAVVESDDPSISNIASSSF